MTHPHAHHVLMNNAATHTELIEAPEIEQLTLLAVPAAGAGTLKSSSAHVRFQLSATTRRRGLAHVAQIRRQLNESQARRDGKNPPAPTRRPHAA